MVKAILFLFCGSWVQGICLSLVSEKQCRSKEKAIDSWSDKFERHKHHVQDPNGSLYRLNMTFCFTHVVEGGPVVGELCVGAPGRGGMPVPGDYR